MITTMPMILARDFLNSLRPIGLGQALRYLRDAGIAKTSLEIMEHMGWNVSLVNGMDPDGIIDYTLGLICQHCGADEEMTREEGYDPTLYPESMGYPMNWDELAALLECDAKEVDKDYYLYLYYTLLRVDEEDHFNKFAEQLGWGVKYANIFIERETYAILLQERGLEDFYQALEVAWYDTGNIFFDFNIDDNEFGYDNLPSYTPEGVENMRLQFEEAQPIREAVNRAEERFAHEPELAKTLMECMLASSSGPGKNLTLAELWADEDEDDGSDL
jgi:hypothetical protein